MSTPPADGTDWPLWFVRLSGWPVFLTVVAAVVCFMVLASILLTKASSRSAVQNLFLGTMVVAAVGFVALFALWFATSR